MLTRRMRTAEQAQHDDSMSAVSRRLRSLPVQRIVPVSRLTAMLRDASVAHELSHYSQLSACTCTVPETACYGEQRLGLTPCR